MLSKHFGNDSQIGGFTMNYQTKARRQLLDCLSDNAESRLSIDEIMSALGASAPGKSTLYRQMKSLCDEGLVRRFASESGKALYQLAGASCCCEHLHFKCLDCGALLHLDGEAQAALCRSAGVVIDDGLSMLYGRCAKCAKRSE